MSRVAFIDHYDSFSLNLIDWLQQATPQVEYDVIPFDLLDVDRFLDERGSEPIVFSPGPHSPNDCKTSLDLARRSLGRVPILGVCLGHQILGVVAGGSIGRDKLAWHGHPRQIFTLDGEAFDAMSYNSLIVSEPMASNDWSVIYRDEEKQIQGIRYAVDGHCAALGVQFHPESFKSKDCDFLKEIWRTLLDGRR
jgi:anthranilate/para-aminobenzoate synthase component II